VRRETQNILLVLLGGALLKISFTGTYLRYVKPAHQWLLIVAGVVMLVLAAVSIARDLTARGPADQLEDHSTEPADHAEHAHSARSAWLLVLPVLAVFLVAPPALGADSVQRSADTAPRAAAPSDDGSALYPALPRADVLPLQVSEFVERAVWDSGDSLNDRDIRLTGFVVHEGDSTYLARIVIGCCAADASPRKVELTGADLSRHPDDSWLEAVVELVPGSATKANDYVPTATVRSVRPVLEPEDSYEY
jgi:uncharacterized repeat protein (TIGR03943 family)